MINISSYLYMSLSKIISVIIVVGIVSVGSIVVVQKMKQEDAPQNPENTTEVPPVESTYREEPLEAPTEKKIPFADFLSQGGSYECSVKQFLEDVESKGLVYIHNNMIRGSFTTATQGMVIDSSLIVRDGYTYTWSSLMQGKGVRVPVATGENTTTDSSTQMQDSYSFNAEHIGDYDCEPWTPDFTQFELPDGIAFAPLQ